jgi:uncharacterized membrane protein YdjX (TVP38/TMEM64 family)
MARGSAMSQSGTASQGRIVRAALVVGVLGGLVVLLRAFPVEERLLDFVQWVRAAGTAGVGVFILAYVLAAVLFLPGSILTLGAGFVYGVIKGTAIVWVAANTSAALAFLLGRTLAREWIAGKVRAKPGFAAIDRAVGAQGFKIVLLTRLSPAFPFSLLNYAYGLTSVRFRDYVLGSLIGMLPGTVMYVYLGSLVTSVTELASGRASGGTAEKLFYFAGLVVTILVTVYVTRVARRALAAATHEAGAQGAG